MKNEYFLNLFSFLFQALKRHVMTFGMITNAQKRKGKNNAVEGGLLKTAKGRVICAKVINAWIEYFMDFFVFRNWWSLNSDMKNKWFLNLFSFLFQALMRHVMTFGMITNAQKRKGKNNAVKGGLLKTAKGRVTCAKVINLWIEYFIYLFCTFHHF